jgi:nitrous-oxide reductase
VPRAPGVFPFYCTDFCSALHQEMQGYVRVSPAGSTVALSANVSSRAATQTSRARTLPPATAPAVGQAVQTGGDR